MRTPLSRHRRKAVTLVAAATALGVALTAAPAGAAGIGDPYFPEDGNTGYDVANYDVRIAYDPAHPDQLNGDTTVTARALQSLDRLSLDLKGFQVTSVTVNGTPAKSFSRSGSHKLDIVPARRVAGGATFAVRVVYAGKPDPEGWHQLVSGGVNAMGEPHSATSWFPSNDHPSDKATFSLAATVPDGWTAIGNGRPGQTTSKDGSTTFRWREDKPMATYLSTVAIDKFTVHRSALPDGTPVITAYGPDVPIDDMAKATEAQQPEIIAFLASKFGPYPFSSAGAIVRSWTKETGTGAPDLETQSRPTYTNYFWDSAAVHEITHQWFGDSVSFTDWRDGCIAECVAQYANQLWDEHQGSNLDTGFYAPGVEENRNKPEYWSTKLYDPGQGKELASALYFKGSLMMHALRRTVGDDTFFATLKRWTADHAYGNASFPQFEALAAKVSGKDLKGFFDAWAHGTTIPAKEYLYPGPLAPLAPAGSR
ncbi:M1 family metallopeptidase [Kitasatospora sp. NPDC059811]|uniref:M1 family metallopeptidase n=1 Tax=Streptomycetaceae TaxID=2062 RepID=UPI0007AEE9C5|nr:M1 family metallopeptidase [Streptomyces sp. MJM8645]